MHEQQVGGLQHDARPTELSGSKASIWHKGTDAVAVLGSVETHVLLLVRDAEADGELDGEHDEGGASGRVDRGHEDAGNLPAELLAVAVEEAGRAADVGLGEAAREDAAHDACVRPTPGAAPPSPSGPHPTQPRIEAPQHCSQTHKVQCLREWGGAIWRWCGRWERGQHRRCRARQRRRAHRRSPGRS